MKWKTSLLSLSASVSSGQGIIFDFTFQLLLTFLFSLFTYIGYNHWEKATLSKAELTGLNIQNSTPKDEGHAADSHLATFLA